MDDDVKTEVIEPHEEDTNLSQPPLEDTDDNNKEEPEDAADDKEALHQELGFDSNDAMGGGGDDGSYDDMLGSGGEQPQSMADVVAQAMPGSSGYQEVCNTVLFMYVNTVILCI